MQMTAESRKILCFSFFIFYLLNFVIGQDMLAFQQYEDTLKKLSKEIQFNNNDVEKQKANNVFIQTWMQVLNTDKSFFFPFDSLTSVSRLTSPDEKFRIITWSVGRSDGTYDYYGFIQMNPKKNEGTLLYQLFDFSDSLNNPEISVCNRLNWFGALYYKLIKEKYNGKEYYTLLGWNGKGLVSGKKIIEVLTFSDKNTPVFGADIFSGFAKKKAAKRIIFEYSKKISMSLKYQQQYVSKGDNKNWMIVFDRLVPMSSNLEGVYCYYVPASNIYDACVFENGKWKFIKDVDARNQPRKIKQRKADKGLLPGK